MDQRILTILAVLLAAIFLVLFLAAVARRGRPEAPALFRSSNVLLGIAGLFMIAAGFVAHGDTANIILGLLFIVLGTGMDFGANRRKSG